MSLTRRFALRNDMAKQLCDNAIFPNCLLIELIIFSLNPELFGQEEERRDEFTVCF
jgi:hypothetical protein